MSTYYYGNIYKRNKKTDKYELMNKDHIDMGFYKSNLLTGWDYEGEQVYPKSIQLENLCKETTCFDHVRFLGRINKEELDNIIPYPFNIDTHKLEYTDYKLKNGIQESSFESDGMLLVSDTVDDVNLLKTIYDNDLFVELSNQEMSDYIKATDEEKKKINSVYYNIYFSYKIYYVGVFFNSKSFLEIEKECKDKLENILRKSIEWENIQKSVDYLKLSQKEKDNVWSSYEYEITDEDNYYECRLEACKRMRHALDIFDTDWDTKDDDILWYVWADTAEKTDEPDWVFGKDKLGKYF